MSNILIPLGSPRLRKRRLKSVWGGGGEGAHALSHPLKGLQLLCRSRYVHTVCFLWVFSRFYLDTNLFHIASGRTLLVRRPAYTTQYRFRCRLPTTQTFREIEKSQSTSKLSGTTSASRKLKPRLPPNSPTSPPTLCKSFNQISQSKVDTNRFFFSSPLKYS